MDISILENTSDVISRQAAIDMLKNRWKKTRNYEGIGDDIAEECELYLKQVPSAQPDNRLEKIADIVEGTIDHLDRDDAMDMLYQIKEVLK